MSDMLKNTIVVSIFVESLQGLSEEYLEERSLDIKVAIPYLTRTMGLLLNTSRRNLRNTSHHATRTSFLSVAFSPTMSSVH